MTLNEEIEAFVSKLIQWQAQAAARLVELESQGSTTSREYDDILKDTDHVIELKEALYVTDIELVDEDGDVKLNYLTNTDEDIKEMMHDWSYYLKLDVFPAGQLPLDGQYFVTTTGSSSTGSGLPSGGSAGDLISQDSSGNPIWIGRPTILEVDETV